MKLREMDNYQRWQALENKTVTNQEVIEEDLRDEAIADVSSSRQRAYQTVRADDRMAELDKVTSKAMADYKNILLGKRKAELNDTDRKEVLEKYEALFNEIKSIVSMYQNN